MSISPAFVPDAAHPAPEPFGYRPLSAIAAASAGGVPQKRIGRVLSEIAPALVALHGQDKVHGAISVHTVGLDEFGHAHLLVPALYPDHASSMEPASCFAAVEQFDADPARACGPWTDVYALCAVMCSLVSGSPPPHALARRAQDAYVPLAARKPRGYEESFLAAIDQGLSLAPAQRPPSVQALCEMLGVSCLPEADETPADSRQAASAAIGGHAFEQPHPNLSRRRRLGGLAAIAAGVLAVAAVWAWQSQNDLAEDGSPGRVVVASRSASGYITPAPYAMGERAPGGQPPDTRDNASDDAASSLASPFVPVPDPHQPARRGLGQSDRPGDRSPAPASGPTRIGPGQAGSPPGALPGPSSAVQSGSQSTSQAAAPSAGTAASETAGAAAAPPARPARVAVKVDVRPWGEIFVDGVSRGVSPPLKALHLPAGRHTVEVRNADLPPYRVSIDLKPGQPITLHHIFR